MNYLLIFEFIKTGINTSLYKNIIAKLLIILIICSCGEHEGEPGVEDIIKISPSTANEPQLLSSVIEDFYFVKLQPEYRIGNIDKLKVRNNSIIVMDKMSNSIITFDLSGREQLRIKSKGRGPGEFFRLMDFTYDVYNNAYLLYVDHGLIKKFDSCGTFVEQTLIVEPIYDFEVVANDRVLHHGGYISQRPDSAKFVLYDLEFESLTGYVSKMFSYSDREVNSTYHPGSYFSLSQKSLLFSHQFDNHIYEVKLPVIDTISNVIKPKYHVDFGHENLPIGQIISPSKDFDGMKKYKFINGCVHETSQMLYIEFLQGDRTLRYWKSLNERISDIGYEGLKLDDFLITWGVPIKGTNRDYFINEVNGLEMMNIIDSYIDYLETHFPEKVEDFNSFLEAQQLTNIDANDDPILTFFKFQDN